MIETYYNSFTLLINSLFKAETVTSPPLYLPVMLLQPLYPA